MSELRTLHRRVPVTTPPFDAVVANARRIRVRQLRSALGVAALLVALAGLSLAPAVKTAVRPAEQRSGHSTTEGDTGSPPSSSAGPGRLSTTTAVTAASSEAPPPGDPGPQYRCDRGGNGGATGPGVTADRIRLFGSGRLDGPIPQAWKIVFDEVNRGGGICGRIVDLHVADQGFRQVPDDFLAFLVGPFDDDFEDRLADGSIDRAATPAVESDAYPRSAPSGAWDRRVGLPAASFARVAADEAYRAGARTFGLVHDPENARGDEVEAALRAYVARLPGASVKAAQALDPEQPSYAYEAAAFSEQCGCDAVLLSLLPDTAVKWFQKNPPVGTVRTAVAPPLLTDRFAQDCVQQLGGQCENFWAWSGFTPPLAQFRGDPDVDRYARSFEDPMNPFTTGAYVAAQVLVEALQRTGPNLTRERLRQTLDDMTYESGLVDRLDWPAGSRSARAVRMELSQGTFRRYTPVGTGWYHDPG